MDFYEYINSKDVAEHLRKMNFEFNSLQCLWIIFQNEGITLNEKIAALEYILTMQDYKIKDSNNMSVHKMINKYFKYIKKIKKELTEIDDNSFYTGFIDYEEHTSHLAIYFKDYKSCLKHIKESIDNTKRSIKGFQIHKIPFNTYEDIIKAKYKNDELVSIHKCGNWDPIISFCEFIEIKLPHPFKQGDILYDKIEQRPVVLQGVFEEGMEALCYVIPDEGKNVKIDMVLSYTDLEFYKEELVGKDISLYAISEFVKNHPMV